MRVLVLSSVLPHPEVVSGFIIVHKRIEMLLERGYEVGLASFVRDDNERWIPELRSRLFEVETLPVPKPKPLLTRIKNSLWSNKPPHFHYLDTDEMRRLIGEMIQRSHYDVVIAEFLVMGHFLYHNPYVPPVRRIISTHGCYTATFRKQIDLNPWSWRGIINQIRLPAAERLEFEIYRSADHVLALTPQDRYELLEHAPELNATVIPYGVDLEAFSKDPIPDREKSLLFTGYFHHEPNCDAVRWFVRKVWPKLKQQHPDLKFYVVGRKPPPDIVDLRRQDENIIVTGEVASLDPYLENCQIYVCPVRTGSGFRGKILQAMAARIPVVSTTLGAEGFPAQTGHNVILADNAKIMADQVSLLLDEPELRNRIAENARSLIDPAYTWSAGIDRLENVLHQVVT